ncbi:MAG TPA: TonB-dependent receptor [Pyrinomonadaceae bacterium]|nr:TonB-dependent receptor [Pyrinomonadaceae bacterium]
MRHRIFRPAVLLSLLLLLLPARGLAQQSAGTIRGTVTLADAGTPIHNAIVTLVQLRRSVQTDLNGAYEFRNVPAGGYTILVHMEGFPDQTRRGTLASGGEQTHDFQMRLTGLREEVTVTATGTEQSLFEAFQAVNTLDPIRISEEAHPSLGEVLNKEVGVAKRSFGPGSSRPVIRGFDGDRVLVVQDGVRTGSLGSQSGDHGEPVDVLSLERIEVVRGPATLLYGSNAIGGVVNAITGHDYAHEGWRGFFTGIGGTTNNQGGAAGGAEYGTGRWMFWGNGSLQRTGDYDTPLGRVPNSKTRSAYGLGGFGWYGDKAFFSGSYSLDDRRYGVPFAGQFEGHGHDDDDDHHLKSAGLSGNLFGGTAPSAAEDEGEQIDLDMRRHNVQFNGGFRNLNSFVDSLRLTLDYSDYQHRELEGEEVGTIFNNEQLVYRGVFEQRRTGRLTGSFGFSGFRRDYATIGAETLAPPVKQDSIAVFAVETLDFERVSFQFGGRVENNRYRPEGLRDRSFTGFSGAAGVRVPLWRDGAFVANYTHSYRAPALEELYNFGPHIGNLTFEIGNPDLTRERNHGFDFSLRHHSDRVRAEANFFYYNIKDFVFLAPVDEDGDGEIDIEDGLRVARYMQGDSRYVGGEIDLNFGLHRNVWLDLGFDTVSARLDDGTPLPRIPPMRGRVGLDLRRGGLSLRPELIMAKDKREVFPTETRTAGYAVFNVLGSYTLARRHYAHIFTFNAFNLGDKLYRNHLSLIKELAPEIGRGLRVTYSVRFF